MTAPDDQPAPHVPARVVVLSIFAVWLCYFVLVTLRGAIVGFELNWAFVSRRLAVTLASIAVTGALWPLLQRLDARPLWLKAAAIVIGALPASLLLAAINQWAFADIENQMMPIGQRHERISIRRDETGNVLVDLAAPPPPPPRPPNPPPRTGDAVTGTPAVPAPPASVTIVGQNAAGDGAQPDGRWALLSDIASGRYFLLLAWAAVYVALVTGEQARAAERREGAYRRAAAASELRSLRYQVNPHFLFNTLNSLSALVMTGREEDAERMIQTLATFYRRTLASDPTADLPLAAEVELQQLYLDIEAVRFPHRLLRAVDLPASLTGALVPGMILQPLVENAVKYAVAASTGAVTITIAARLERGRLVLTVADDGTRGAAPHADAVAAPRGLGVGLANVRDRLVARFGEATSLEAGPRPGGGFATVLRMPLVHADA